MNKFVLLLLAIAPLVFAQTDCEQSCCYSAGGSWDYDFDWCDGPSSSYYDCINQCEGSAGFNTSCCGAAFLLASIGAAVFFAKKN